MNTQDTEEHSPGPWHLPPLPASGIDLAVITNPQNGKAQIVAMVTIDEDYPQDEAERLANARLIAAAPDLLAACERFTFNGVCTCDGYGEDRGDLICDHCEARAAIAKARGTA